MKRILTTAFLIWVATTAVAQSTVAAPAPLTPESAYVGPDKYVNAFFGFSLLLPKDAQVSAPLKPQADGRQTLSLISFVKAGSTKPGFTTVMVAALPSPTASSADAQKKASAGGGGKAKPINIGGKEFWKSEGKQQTAAGKLRVVQYVTNLRGYLLEIVILAFDGKLAGQLQGNIEAMQFFDPALAREIAGPGSRPLQRKETIADLPPGTVVGNKYTHEQLGFTYHFPQGWSVADTATQTKVTDSGHQTVYGQNPAAAREHEAAQQCMRTLLWVSARPEAVGTPGTASRIVVFVADPACMSGFRFPLSLEDKAGIPLTAQQLTSAFASLPTLGGGMQNVKAYAIQGRVMIDLSGAIGPAARPENTTLASLIITETNGYLVGWIFGSGSSTGLAEMKRSTIEFLNAPTSPPTPPK